MERMLTTIKEHGHPSLINQEGITTRGIDLVTKTATPPRNQVAVGYKRGDEEGGENKSSEY
jgi:hypothetical protein